MPYIVTEEYIDEKTGKLCKRPVEVADGLWVAHSSYSFSEEGEWYYDDRGDRDHYWSETNVRTDQVVGPTPERRIQTHSHRYSENYDNSHTASSSRSLVLVGQQPFGLIRRYEFNGQQFGGYWFDCARQVHSGQLGRRPQIARPQFARETYRYHAERPLNCFDKPIRARDARRGKIGWARLVDVAELVGMPPVEVVLRYFLFTDMEQPQLHVVMADDRRQIHGQLVGRDRIEKLAAADLPELFRRPLDHIWVRQGFAMTVLYLHHFGPAPEPIAVPQPV